MQHFNLLTPVVRITKTRILQNRSGGLFSSLGHLKNLGTSIFKIQPVGQFERVPIFWSFDGRLNTSPRSPKAIFYLLGCPLVVIVRALGGHG